MKSYTDLEQSKKLAEILPLESADMRYDEYTSHIDGTPKVGYKEGITEGIPCWSLAALLNVLPYDCGIDKEDGKYIASYILSNECGAYTKDNPVDACYEMIIYLHELNLL